jgi:hypothetical protein
LKCAFPQSKAVQMGIVKRASQLGLAVSLMALLGSPAGAQVFKCKDADGKTIFSDKACEGSKGAPIDLKFRGVNSPRVEAAPSIPVAPAPLPKIPEVASPATALAQKTPPELPLADRLAALCVDSYRPHLAYPQGVRVVGRTLEKSLSEYLITVEVQTISNPATPARIDPIIIHEKFICVTDGGAGLNARSTGIYVDRHKRGDRL